MIIVYCVLFIFGMVVLDLLFDWDLSFVSRVVISLVFIVSVSGVSVEDTNQDIDITNTSLAKIGTPSDIKQLQPYVVEGKQTINELKVVADAVVTELSTTTEGVIAEHDIKKDKHITSDHMGYMVMVAILACVAFLVVSLLIDSVMVGSVAFVIVMTTALSNLPPPTNQLSATPNELIPVDVSDQTKIVEYMSNSTRAKTPVYLYENATILVATSSPTLADDAVLIFSPQRLARHTSGQLYACKTVNQCYPVKVYE